VRLPSLRQYPLESALIVFCCSSSSICSIGYFIHWDTPNPIFRRFFLSSFSVSRSIIWAGLRRCTVPWRTSTCTARRPSHVYSAGEELRNNERNTHHRMACSTSSPLSDTIHDDTLKLSRLRYHAERQRVCRRLCRPRLTATGERAVWSMLLAAFLIATMNRKMEDDVVATPWVFTLVSTFSQQVELD
jgi:hypothetical protein